MELGPEALPSGREAPCKPRAHRRTARPKVARARSASRLRARGRIGTELGPPTGSPRDAGASTSGLLGDRSDEQIHMSIPLIVILSTLAPTESPTTSSTYSSWE